MHYVKSTPLQEVGGGGGAASAALRMPGCAPLRRRMRFFTTPNICRPSFSGVMPSK
jgi:hypothetical protein